MRAAWTQRRKRAAGATAKAVASATKAASI